MDEAELIKRLLETFKIEVKEHINTISKGLIELEKDLDAEKSAKILEEIYRSAHSMKGASRAVNLTEIEQICQALESCFSKMKNKELKASSQVFDIFHSVINTIELLVNNDEEKPDKDVISHYINTLLNIEAYQETLPPPDTNQPKKTAVKKQQEDEKKIEKEETKTHPKPQEESKEAPIKTPHIKEDTIRLSSKKIDEIYLLAEESLQVKLFHQQEFNEIKLMAEDIKRIRKAWSVVYSNILNLKQNKDIQKEKLGSTLFANIDTIDESIKNVERKFNALQNTSRFVQNTTQNILDNLVDEIKQVLMLPFSNLLDGFPRLVRDLSKAMHKEIEIEIVGSNIEVDRRIMEELKDPLIHLIRNSVDHGIATPTERLKAGKDKKGIININIQQVDANNVKIDIKDDGRGIDIEQLKEKAIKLGHINKEETKQLSEEEILKMLFKSGITTTKIITDISGRGLGLAIVEEKVEKLGGNVEVKSQKDKGATFSIIVPTSISKTQGLVVLSNQNKYIIPVSNILETLRVKKSYLKKVENRDTIQHQKKTLPIVNLADVLQIGFNEKGKRNSFLHIVIIESLNQRIGFVVDEIVNEQEVLFKKLNHPLQKVKNIAGVSLLGTGEICPIINSQDIVKSSVEIAPTMPVQKGEKGDKATKKSILIAEDSITSRLFLKNILESAGYKVRATIDGREAFTALKQEPFDLLISDIEMPRMNGFELTENIRKDKVLGELPIVLVTSLSKREDQEKGIEVGANAYIIKSSFEQSNLLEVIKRLI